VSVKADGVKGWVVGSLTDKMENGFVCEENGRSFWFSRMFDDTVAADVNLGECHIQSTIIITSISNSSGDISSRVVRCDVNDKCQLVGKMANEIVI